MCRVHSCKSKRRGFCSNHYRRKCLDPECYEVRLKHTGMCAFHSRDLKKCIKCGFNCDIHGCMYINCVNEVFEGRLCHEHSITIGTGFNFYRNAATPNCACGSISHFREFNDPKASLCIKHQRKDSVPIIYCVILGCRHMANVCAQNNYIPTHCSSHGAMEEPKVTKCELCDASAVCKKYGDIGPYVRCVTHRETGMFHFKELEIGGIFSVL